MFLKVFVFEFLILWDVKVICLRIGVYDKFDYNKSNLNFSVDFFKVMKMEDRKERKKKRVKLSVGS